MRCLAAQFRGFAAHTALLLYQVQMLAAASELEREAAGLADPSSRPPEAYHYDGPYDLRTG